MDEWSKDPCKGFGEASSQLSFKHYFDCCVSEVSFINYGTVLSVRLHICMSHTMDVNCRWVSGSQRDNAKINAQGIYLSL